jgi:acyl-coenzyme A synthetase/AMP-(fatty) acid ligase
MREDGNIIFKGRKDSLIKHMGYRIELGEIEHVIENELKLVEYCCAVYRYAKKEIVLYYQNDKDITDREFRTMWSKAFPAYMIPTAYVRLDELPRNTNGKIDRLLLKNKANGET